MLVILGLAVAFGGLVWARYSNSRHLSASLHVIGIGLVFACSWIVLLFLTKAARSPLVAAATGAALLGGAAVAARISLASRPRIPEGQPVPISFLKTLTVDLTWIGGALALLLGALTLWNIVSSPPEARKKGRKARRKSTVMLVLSCAGMSAGLYSLAPLARSMGIQANHWTFLGLLGLAFLVFLATAAADKISSKFSRRSGSSDRNGRRTP